MTEWSEGHVAAIGSYIFNFDSCWWILVKLETGWGP
jgi:hypothetical protein